MPSGMASRKKPTPAEIADLIERRVKKAVTRRGNAVSVDLGQLSPPKPINGGARQLLSRNGHTNAAKGNIEE